jgi:hypothetical protein
MLCEQFIKSPELAAAAKEVRSWGLIVAAFALGLGTVNLVMIHTDKVSKKKEGWANSIVLMAGLLVFAIMGVSLGTSHKTYTTMYDTFVSPMATAMFGTLIFYIVSAGYRSFVIRRLESAVILASALIVMLSAVPIGRMISPLIPEAATWLQNIPNNAGQRGLVIGAAVGAVANGLRVMLGLERNFGG